MSTPAVTLDARAVTARTLQERNQRKCARSSPTALRARSSHERDTDLDALRCRRYTGTLIAGQAKQLGHRPLLAGRNAPADVALAEQLDLPYRILTLDDPATLQAALADVDLVRRPLSATVLLPDRLG
jgi:hypothetical protein